MSWKYRHGVERSPEWVAWTQRHLRNAQVLALEVRNTPSEFEAALLAGVIAGFWTRADFDELRALNADHVKALIG